MKNKLLAIVFITFCCKSASAQSGTSEPITLSIKIKNEYKVRWSKDRFEESPGQGQISVDSVDQLTYDVEILVKNNAAKDVYFWAMNCSWQDNFLMNNNYIGLNGNNRCYKNFEELFKLGPGDVKKYNAVLTKSIEFQYPCESCTFPHVETTKVGLILIDDIFNPKLDLRYGYRLAMNDKSKWNIIWSNPLYLLSPKEANPDKHTL